MGAGETIAAEVASWQGVTTQPGPFGATSFMLGRRELGHVHGDSVADFAFPRRIADMLVETGRARPHRWTDSPGVVSRDLETDEDAADVIELFRLAYERAQVAARVRGSD